MKNFESATLEFPPRPLPIWWGALLGIALGGGAFALHQQFPGLPILEWQQIVGHGLTLALLVPLLVTWRRLAVCSALIPASEQAAASTAPRWFIQSAKQAVALRDKRLRYELPALYDLVNKAEEGYRRSYQSYLGLFFLIEILMVFGGLLFGFLRNGEDYETSVLSNRFLTLIVVSVETSFCLLLTMHTANVGGAMFAKWNHSVCTRLAQDDQLVIPFHDEMISTKAPPIPDLPDFALPLSPDQSSNQADDLFSRDFGNVDTGPAKKSSDSPWQWNGPAADDSPSASARKYTNDPEI